MTTVYEPRHRGGQHPDDKPSVLVHRNVQMFLGAHLPVGRHVRVEEVSR